MYKKEVEGKPYKFKSSYQSLLSYYVAKLADHVFHLTPFKVFMPLPILSNQYQRESASKSREKSLFVQLVNKLLTNCCLSYFKLAGRR